MDFNIVFLFIIFLFNLFLLLILLSVKKVFYSTNINKYKINSIFEFYICLFFLFIYIFFFIFILYLLRYFSLGKTTNLFDMYKIINGYFLIFLNFSLPLKIVFFLIVISLLLIFFFFLIILKNCSILIFLKLFCYDKISSNYNLINFLRDIGLYNSDIISYFIYKFSGYIATLQYGESLSYKKLWRIHPLIVTSKIHNKTYNFIISISPIIFFVFEALLNDFFLHYIYYYLILFTPVMIIKRITNYLYKICMPMKNLLWDIYYNDKEVEELKGFLRDTTYNNHKGKIIIYAISPKMKPFFDKILLNDLVLEHFDGDDILGFYFKSNVIFIANDPVKDIYSGESGTLILEYDNNMHKYRVYEEIEKEIQDINGTFKIEYFKGDEWILLCKK